jgi:hypothetical protein
VGCDLHMVYYLAFKLIGMNEFSLVDKKKGNKFRVSSFGFVKFFILVTAE